MTATTQTVSTGSPKRTVGSGPPVPGAPPVPQVNLLPPEVRAQRSLRTTKRLLVMALAGVVGLAVVGGVAAQFQLSAAESELAREQAETQRLLAEQAKYAEVPQVLGELDRAQESLLLGTTTEVLWEPYLSALMATAPADVIFSDISVIGATPMQPPAAPMHPLEPESQLRLTFGGRAVELPDASAWMEALDSIDGFTGAYVTSLDLGMGSGSWDETASYEVVGSVLITDEALAERFAEQEED